MKRLLSIFVPENRLRLIVVAAVLIAGIAVIDWFTRPYLSLGFLYLFPIIILGGVLSRGQIVGLAFLCAVLSESFSNLPENEAIFRLLLSSVGFSGTGLFISELLRNRRTVQKHVEELEKEVSLRREAEEQLHVLLESSPAAIVTINAVGEICLANQAAQQLLAPNNLPLEGQSITSYLPSLHTVLQTQPERTFRTTLQCKGQRGTGEAFLAGVWFSTYRTVSDLRLAAVVVDLSEELRNREDLSLDHLLRTSRILVSAVAHEVRNLCGAAVVLQKNLSRVRGLTDNEDFQALTSLIQSLERMSALSLKTAPPDAAATVELPSVLDELRVLIEGTLGESSIQIDWQAPEHLPLVWADRYGLIQVFLNLVKNSQRAMESTDTKKLCISVMTEENHVSIRFEDTGIGITNPENLFRPFRPGVEATGLGLYVSRSIMRSFGGDLVYEPRPRGCCFAVAVPAVIRVGEIVNA
jgi:two-component system, LuxR family, sensor kinase FixL